MILLIWVGIDASVPMPFSSIFAINSASVKYPGDSVLFSVTLVLIISMISPDAKRGISLSACFYHGITAKNPSSTRIWPFSLNFSSPIIRIVFTESYIASLEMQARKLLMMYWYTFSSRSLNWPGRAALTGVMGGWSPASTPYLGFLNPSYKSVYAWSPYFSWSLSEFKTSLKLKLLEKVVDSVLG